MFDENAYNVITESLQSDIDMGMISYEYASIINDLSYSVYVENAETNENMLGILDKYIDRIMSYRLFESVVDVIQNITEAFNDGEITEAEHDALLEAVQDKFYEAEYCTEETHQERRTISLNKKDYEKKIGVAVDNWERKVKYVVADSIKEAKKEEAEEEKDGESIKSDSSDKSKSASARTAAPKPRKKFHIDEDVIMKKLMPVGVALVTAIGGLGLGKEISKVNKEIKEAEKRIATSVYSVGDIEVQDAYHRLDGISDELKENLYELVKAGPADDVDTWHIDRGLNIQFHAQNKDGKKILKVEPRRGGQKSGPVDIRGEEKEIADYNKEHGIYPSSTLETKIIRQKAKYSTDKLGEAHDNAVDEYYKALEKKKDYEKKDRNGEITLGPRLMRTVNAKVEAAKSASDDLNKAYKKAKELERKQNISVEEYDKIIGDMIDEMGHVNKDLSVKYDTK
jgi:hypothetical protein